MASHTFLIAFHDLRLDACIGWEDAERAAWQPVSFDIEIKIEAQDDVLQEDLRASLDYRLVVKMLKRVCAEQSWRLLEKMCHDNAHALLGLSAAIKEVKLRISKFVFPEARSVSVEITVQA